MPHPAGSTSRTRTSLIISAVVAVAVAVPVALAVTRSGAGSGQGSSPHQQLDAGEQAQGQTRSAAVGERATSAAADAATATGCPRGNEPYVNFTEAHFAPQLMKATQFRSGTYRIVLTGRLVNETSAAIRIVSLNPQVHGRPWAARVSAPTSLPPHGEATVRIEGSYTARQVEQAETGAALSWDWADERYADCGEDTLLSED